MVGMHGHTLHDELLHVPLLVKYPCAWHGGSTVEAQVRSIDIAPTVLAALGLATPAVFEGSDLTGCAAGGRCPPPYAVSTIDGGRSCVRSLEWKWDGGRLYDLRRDPAERVDVAARHAGRTEELQRIREEIVTEVASGDDAQMNIDPGLRERLKSLGYIQ
jgi:N-acetylglucosamine-6-sulfatase